MGNDFNKTDVYMSISDEAELALHLAYFNIPACEFDKYAKQIQSIVGFIKKIQEVNVCGILPMRCGNLDVNNALILSCDDISDHSTNDEDEDENGEYGDLMREKIFKNAPKANGMFFVVPVVVE